MFKRFLTRNGFAKERVIEEHIYEMVALELQKGEKRIGLWTKAVSLSDGHQGKAESLYIQLRAKSIVDEVKILDELQEKKQEAKVLAKQLVYTTEKLQAILDDKFGDIVFATISIDDFKSIFLNFEPNLRKRIINTEDLLGSCLIHYTVKSGRLDCTEFLISEGANTYIKNCWGSTPLDIAEHFKRTRLVELLTDARQLKC